MNVTQILLGSTAALLLVAIVLSYTDMQNGVAANGRAQSAAELMKENAQLQAEILQLKSGNVTPIPPTPAPPKEELATSSISENELAQFREQNDLLKQQLEVEQNKREQAEADASALTERNHGKINQDERRAKLISIASLMAQVTEIAEEGDITVIVLDVIIPQAVQLGTELAIRRGNGIAGKLSVTNIADGTVFADPILGSFPGGEVDVKIGDELIIPIP